MINSKRNENTDGTYIADTTTRTKSWMLWARILKRSYVLFEGRITIMLTSSRTQVLDKSKIVILMLYAPWNRNSQQLRPMWRTIASKYSQNKNIVVAQMDASENEHESISFMSKYPTLAIWRKADDTPIAYDGSFSFESIQQWVKENVNVYHTEL